MEQTKRLTDANSRSSRRGVSMLLVLISLMTATIVTVAYLSSRDNSPLIGENVTDTAQARWAAATGIELAVATLQAEGTFDALPSDGVILSNYAISGATLDVVLTDQITGDPPTTESIYFILTSTARVGSIEQTARGVLEIKPSVNDIVTVDLSEFAVFTAESFQMSNDAVIARWPESPMSQLGRTIHMGTQATSSSRVQLQHRAAALDSVLLHRESASGALVNNSTNTTMRQRGLEDTIPMPLPPDPDAERPDGTPNPPNNVMGTSTIDSSQRFGTVRLQNGTSRLNLVGDITLTVDDSLRMNDRSGISVNGNATLIVFGDVEMRSDSWIELAPDATLTMYIGGDLDANEAYIGDQRADPSVRDTSGHAPWINARRLIMLSIDPEDGTLRDWNLNGDSVVKGNIYAPTANLAARNSSTIYGRVAARSVGLRGHAAIFYDHALDTRYGYTDSGSQVYDDDGRIRSEIRNLTKLSAQAVSDLADSLDRTVYSLFTGLVSNASSSSSTSGTSSPDPTPRPIPVDFAVVAYGYDVDTWEAAP